MSKYAGTRKIYIIQENTSIDAFIWRQRLDLIASIYHAVDKRFNIWNITESNNMNLPTSTQTRELLRLAIKMELEK